MTDLHARLLAELDRREAIAKVASLCEGMPEPDWTATQGHDNEVTSARASVAFCDHDALAAFIALHDPADALRRYAHYRRVLERHGPVPDPFEREPLVVCAYGCCDGDGWGLPWDRCPEIRDLADALGVAVDGAS